MAAASYAMPTTVMHGGGHVHSHSRKSMSQRVPLQPTSMNGGLPINGGHPAASELKSHSHSHSSPLEFASASQATNIDHSHLDAHLPAPNLPSLKPGSIRSKSMDRRRSVGLPTHLRLQGSGYGYKPASTQRFIPLNEEAARQWITSSEIISSVLIPLPYVLASLAFTFEDKLQATKVPLTIRPNTKTITEDLPVFEDSSPGIQSALLITCAITSATLILVGLGGKLQRGKSDRAANVLDRRKVSFGSESEVARPQLGRSTSSSISRLVRRILSVGLPFYATTKLGADRITLVILVALATNFTMTNEKGTELTSIKGWKRMLRSQCWTWGSILIQIIADIAGATSHNTSSAICMGYLALGVSILALPPPFPVSKPTTSASSSEGPQSPSIAAVVRPKLETVPLVDLTLSPLVGTAEDANLTLMAGTILGVFTCILLFFSTSSTGALSSIPVGWVLLSTFASILALTLAQPQSIRLNKGLGLAFGALLCSLLSTFLCHGPWNSFMYQGVFIGISFLATNRDTQSLISESSHLEHDHHTPHQHSKVHVAQHSQPSRLSMVLLRLFQDWPLLHSILAEKDSRRIFYFMSLNFAFMLVQTFYGIATGSLGLLSDSIHMFFDCLALVVGLCAAVMSKWPPSTRFPYGFGKMDTLAGFANGIFLMLISVEIVYEAIERLAEGSEMQRIGELLTVSTLGLLVNLVGMTAFGHAHHGHSHGGHDHSSHSHDTHGHGAGHELHDHHDDHESHHDHGNKDHDDQECHEHDHLHDHLHTGSTVSPFSVPATPSKPGHNHPHSHGHDHGHSHGNENMHGIYLHILADTLGSVAVVISTLLIHYYGWSGFDPLASCLIAILIFASAIPLVTSSAKTLLLTIPEDTEFDLREALAGVSGLRGVVGYAVPKFWLEEGNDRRVLGVIHVIAGKGVDMEDVKQRAVAFLKGRQMNVLVQVEREGVVGCWCKSGLNAR